MTPEWIVEIDRGDGQRSRFAVAHDSNEVGYSLTDVAWGRHPGPPTHAVFARWLVRDVGRRPDFEASRHELFELRREHIELFVCDLLLQPNGSEGEYVVVGLYASRDAAESARSHPAIVDWAREHPVALLTAEDLTGVIGGRVANWKSPRRPT